MQVLAIVAISIMFIGLYETIMEFISRSITGVLSQTLQNETIFIILAIGITFLFASIFNGVMGSLAYFSVHTDNDDGVDKKMTLK